MVTRFHRVLRDRPGLLAVVGALSLATACGGEGTAPNAPTPSVSSPAPVGGPVTGAEGQPARYPLPESLGGLVLPSSAFEPSPWQLHRSELATYELDRRCIARYGLEPYMLPRAFAGPLTTEELRYGGPLNVEQAKAWGYWMSGSDQVTDQPTEMDDRTREAFTIVQAPFGDKSQGYQGKELPREGCTGEVDRFLSGNPDITHEQHNADFGSGNVLANAAYNQARESPGVRAAERKWSVCMAGKGYEFPADVFSAGNSLGGPQVRPKPEPGGEEVRMATADAQCMQDADVASVWFQEEKRLQEEAIAKDPALWQKRADYVKTWMDNVEAFLVENPVIPHSRTVTADDMTSPSAAADG